MTLLLTEWARKTGQIALLVLALSLAFAAPTMAGTVYVAPVLTLPTTAPVIGVRYTLRIHTLEGTGNPFDHANKIVFLGSQFTGPSPTGLYVTGVNVFTWSQAYADQPGCPSSGGGTPTYGVGALWVGVPDYALTRNIGLRQLTGDTLATFPRQNGGIDGIHGLSAIWAISQRDFFGQDVQVSLLRGQQFITPLDGWGGRWVPDPTQPGQFVCDPLLPPGLYREWGLTITTRDSHYRFVLAEPDAHADRLWPPGAMSIVTEFLDQRGLFVLYLWGMAILQEGQDWLPLRQWMTTFRADPLPNIGWGVKVGHYGGRSVLEVSNDDTATYAQVGETVTLDDAPVVSIPILSRWGQAALIGGVLLILWTRLGGHRHA